MLHSDLLGSLLPLLHNLPQALLCFCFQRPGHRTVWHSWAEERKSQSTCKFTSAPPQLLPSANDWQGTREANLWTWGQDNPDLQELVNPSSGLDLSLVPGLTSAPLCPAPPTSPTPTLAYQFLLGTLTSKLYRQSLSQSVKNISMVYILLVFMVCPNNTCRKDQTQDFVIMGPWFHSQSHKQWVRSISTP